MQVTGRLPGCPEANTIPDGEGDPADGKADAVKAVAWISTQRAHAGLQCCLYRTWDVQFWLRVGFSSLRSCYRSRL